MANISPGVYSKVIDLSTYVRSVPGTVGFISLVSEKGPDNELVATNARDFYLDFGAPNINFGGTYMQSFTQGAYVASSFLTESDNLYVIRVLPEHANYATLLLAIKTQDIEQCNDELNSIYDNFAVVKQENIDIEDTSLSFSNPDDVVLIKELVSEYLNCEVIIEGDDEDLFDISYRDAKVIIYNIISNKIQESTTINNLFKVSGLKAGSANSYAEINNVLLNSALSVDSTTGDFVVDQFGEYYPLILFYGRGRGEWYNGIKLRLYPHNNPIKAAEGLYILDIQAKQEEKSYDDEYKVWSDNYEIIQSLEVSLNPYKVDKDGESLFIINVLNRYFRYANADSNVDKEFIKSIDDILLRFNARMMYCDYYTLKSTSSTKKIKIVDDSGYKVDASSNLVFPGDFDKKYSINFAGTFDPISATFEDFIALKNGSDGFENMSPEEAYDTIRMLLSRAYTGTLQKYNKVVGDYDTNIQAVPRYVDEVLNTDNIYFNVVFDAGYPSDVKSSIVSLCRDMRKDCIAIIDNGDNKNVDESLNNRIELNNFNTEYASIYEPYTYIYDKFTGNEIWITPIYHIARIIPHTENITELWMAPAGFNRGIINNVNNLRFNPRKGERDQLYLNQINPIVRFNTGTVVWSQLTTLRKSSALQDLNIMRLFLYIDRALKEYCANYIFEPNDEYPQTSVARDITKFLENVKQRRGLYDFSVEVGATELEIKNKTMHVKVILNPTKVIEKIEIEFTIV